MISEFALAAALLYHTVAAILESGNYKPINRMPFQTALHPLSKATKVALILINKTSIFLTKDLLTKYGIKNYNYR